MTEPPKAATAAGRGEGTDLLAGARWITHPAWAGDDPPWAPPVLRTVIETSQRPVRAELIVLAGGVWTAHLGGRPVSPDVLEPGSSDFARRIAVRHYDVVDLIAPGRTEFLLQLGEGSAHVRRAADRYTKFVGLLVAPRARVAIMLGFADGSEQRVVSDQSWQARLGPTTLSHWYGGEDYDARLEPVGWLTTQGSDAHGWEQAVVVGDERSGPEPWQRRTPPVRVQEILQPRRRWRATDGEIVDFGINFAGRQVIGIPADFPAGTRIEMLPGEYVAVDGSVDQHSSGSPIIDTYTTGEPRAGTDWHPQFGYHGLRYLQLRAVGPDGAGLSTESIAVTAERLMTDDREVGTFSCGDDMLTAIHVLVRNAIRSNLFSVPTDCPHREKLGWLEQLHLVFDPLSRSHDVADHLSDMITHLIDAQTADGLIPSIAPELVVFDIPTGLGSDHGFRDDVNWGSLIWRLPLALYRCYGDLGPARTAWRPGLTYLRYLEGICAAGDGGELLDHGLADWIALDESTPRALVASYGLIRMLDAGAALAEALGMDAEQRRLSVKAARLRDRLAADQVRAGADDDAIVVGSGSQASLALVLDLAGLLTTEQQAQAEAALLQRIHADGDRFTVGEIGLPALLRVLSGLNQHGLIRTMISRTDVPGYGQMVAEGCTALAEHWTGVVSRASANHFMLGYVDWWLTGWIGGLRQAPGDIGWRRAEIGIVPLPGIDHAEHSYDGPGGRWEVVWRRSGTAVELRATVPHGASAEIITPPGFTLPGNPERPRIGAGDHRFRFTEIVTD